MRRTPVLLALAVVLATVGAGLVGADPTRGPVATADHGFIPGLRADPGVFGDDAEGGAASAVAGTGDDGGEPRSSGDARPADRALNPADSDRPGGDDTVRVGVIGSAFDRDPSALDGRVAGRYDAGSSQFGLTSGGHDTAVASVVANRADDASLFLASVGYEPTPGAYDRAVRWLVSEDVDVIVDAGSYYPRTAEGRRQIAVAAERAADEGIVFVTSGGNTARRHWRGTATDEGWLAFADGVEGNRLGDGPVSGRVTLRLYWSDDADYDLYLYRDAPGATDPVVAKSTRGEGHAEAIDASLPKGRYYVGVYARDPGGEPVDLFAARHRLAHADAEGSAVAPASAEGVISVGAVGPEGGLTAYSPTDTDVRASGQIELPDGTVFEGTSAAAPAVASVVAAMESRAGDDRLSPAEVERLLRTTARDGRIDADAAVAAAAATDGDGEREPGTADASASTAGRTAANGP